MQNKLTLLLVGDAQAGKTQLIQRWTQQTFTSDYHPTLGIHFSMRSHAYQTHQPCRLHFCDTSGKKSYRTLVTSYLSTADVVSIVIDGSHLFDKVALLTWVQLILEKAPRLPISIVVNQRDLMTAPMQAKLQNEIADLLSSHLPQNYPVSVQFCSAKTGEGVMNVLTHLLDPFEVRLEPIPSSMGSILTPLWDTLAERLSLNSVVKGGLIVASLTVLTALLMAYLLNAILLPLCLAALAITITVGSLALLAWKLYLSGDRCVVNSANTPPVLPPDAKNECYTDKDTHFDSSRSIFTDLFKPCPKPSLPHSLPTSNNHKRH